MNIIQFRTIITQFSHFALAYLFSRRYYIGCVVQLTGAAATQESQIS